MDDIKYMNFQIIMPSERSKYKWLPITSFCLYEMAGKGKTIENMDWWLPGDGSGKKDYLQSGQKNIHGMM